MADFSRWGILRNLLSAARRTLVLSLMAFVGDGVVVLAGTADHSINLRRRSGW
jgi:hypothetical protein